MESIIPISRLYETISFTINMQYLCNLAEYHQQEIESEIVFMIFSLVIFLFHYYIGMSAFRTGRQTVKDNPYDYEHAFAQMVYALGYLNGGRDEFEKETYATDKIALHIERIREIITKRQVDASKDWKAFGESLSGETIPDFDKDEHIAEYKAGNREDTYLGRFFQAAISQKKMVSSRIMESGNRLAGLV